MIEGQIHRDVAANGISLRITEQGTGPLAVLCLLGRYMQALKPGVAKMAKLLERAAG